MAQKKAVIVEAGLTPEQLKLLDYLGDITQELSAMAVAGGFTRISDLLNEAVIEVKALC